MRAALNAAALFTLAAVTLAAASPAAAGGTDWLYFDEPAYQAGARVEAEGGVQSAYPMPATISLSQVTTGRIAAVITPDLTATPADTYVRPTDGLHEPVDYVVELSFRLPPLPPGSYWVAPYWPGPYPPRGPWVGGELRVEGTTPRPARPATPAGVTPA